MWPDQHVLVTVAVVALFAFAVSGYVILKAPR